MTTPPALSKPNVAGLATDSPPPSLEKYTGDRGFFGHPRGLSTVFFVEMWERFSFYGIRPMLVTFMILALAGGGFGFDRQTAGSIVGIYAASVYLTSLPGGWIADRWLGLRRAIWYGGILIAAGHITIAFSGIIGHPMFFVGLILIVMGTGLLKPNISAIVGDLYPDKGARRDAGFSIFYMGINLGATLGPLVTGILRDRAGFHYGFGAAGVGMLAGVLTYRIRAGRTLGPIGLDATGSPKEKRTVKMVVAGIIAVIAAVIVLASMGTITIDAKSVAHKMVYFEVGMAAIYFAYLFFFAGLTRDDLKRVAVIIVLFVFAAIFWSAFEQAPTSLTLFAQDFTDRVIFGFEVPQEWLQTVNSFMVVALAPVFAWIWVAMAKRNIQPSSPTKFAAGLFFAGVGFLIMVPAVREVVASGGTLKVSMLWLIFSYILQTMGELSLSPVGLSSMTKLAPAKFGGQMMGVWFLAASLGNLLAGIVGGDVDPNKLELMSPLFIRTTMSLFIACVVLLLMVRPIRNMMKESSMSGGH
jgi:proton-dependent oligopeptide transporter, POT family